MGTFTWSTASHFDAGPLTNGLNSGLTLPIPANGILKHFIIRKALLYGTQSSTDINGQPGLTVDFRITFTDYLTNVHEIYETIRAPMRTDTVYWEPITVFAHYAVVDTAGDNEFGINQSCSFGKHTDPAPKSVSVSTLIQGSWNAHALHRDGVFSYEFKVLVETIP